MMNMKRTNGFRKTHEDQKRGLLWNGKPIKTLGGNQVEIEEYDFDFQDDLQKVSLLIQQRVL